MTMLQNNSESVSAPSTDAPQLTSIGRQLKAASAITSGFGILMVFGAHELTDGPLRLLADLFILPFDDRGPVTSEAQLLAAILGGVMVSWGLLYWMVIDVLLPQNPALLKHIVMVTIGVWFVIDSLGSLAAGSWINVVSNVGFLAAFILPARRL